MDSVWIQLGFVLNLDWIRFGFGLDSMIMLKVSKHFLSSCFGRSLKIGFDLFGFGLDSVSFRFGFVLGSVSIPLGFILDSISIRCMHIVSDVWDSISAIWN